MASSIPLPLNVDREESNGPAVTMTGYLAQLLTVSHWQKVKKVGQVSTCLPKIGDSQIGRMEEIRIFGNGKMSNIIVRKMETLKPQDLVVDGTILPTLRTLLSTAALPKRRRKKRKIAGRGLRMPTL
jgi:hypothetical protein